MTERTGWRDDAGAASVAAALALAGLLAVTVAVAQVGVVVVARHRAQAGADLAALAAAGELLRGVEAGCAEAETLARRMGVRLVRCEVIGWDAVITVEEELPGAAFGPRSVRAIARAGQVEEGS